MKRLTLTGNGSGEALSKEERGNRLGTVCPLLPSRAFTLPVLLLLPPHTPHCLQASLLTAEQKTDVHLHISTCRDILAVMITLAVYVHAERKREKEKEDAGGGWLWTHGGKLG